MRIKVVAIKKGPSSQNVAESFPSIQEASETAHREIIPFEEPLEVQPLSTELPPKPAGTDSKQPSSS
ncbi:hypothetical protein SESBI_12889 [Sesbania bispinosa]|nr:hypothetical protein SESBI_12889 [Sesbania bispinosa]